MKREEIFTLNKDVALKLFSVYGDKEPLLFPCCRNGKSRISEQESRVIFCNLLYDKKIPFSIETPTLGTYSFSGKYELSARVDLTIYDENKNRVLNIELKSHNPQQKNITKDFEKIVREGKPGNWFHTLENIDRKTIPELIAKFNKALKEVRFQGYPEVSMFIVALGQKLILNYCLNKDACTLPRLEYKISKGDFVLQDSRGWKLEIIK